MEAHRSCLEVSGNWRANTSHSTPMPPHATSEHHSATQYQPRALMMSVITVSAHAHLGAQVMLLPEASSQTLHKLGVISDGSPIGISHGAFYAGMQLDEGI